MHSGLRRYVLLYQRFLLLYIPDIEQVAPGQRLFGFQQAEGAFAQEHGGQSGLPFVQDGGFSQQVRQLAAMQRGEELPVHRRAGEHVVRFEKDDVIFEERTKKVAQERRKVR